MDITSHYYALLAFCRACGYTKESAFKIAYASQFVDDAKINLITVKNPPSTIKFDLINTKPSLFNMSTCHSYFKMNTFNYLSMIYNTSAFHFSPGCEGKTFTKKMRCKQKSPVITKILNDAVKENNASALKKINIAPSMGKMFEDYDLIRFGMLLHIYADTYSHQGFSGIVSEENNIHNLKMLSNYRKNITDMFIDFFKHLFRNDFDGLLDKALPCYGHGQAFTCPDEPYLKWSYEYDKSTDLSGDYVSSEVIDNRIRYKEAFESIVVYLQNFIRARKQYQDSTQLNSYNQLFTLLTMECSMPDKIKKWRRFMVEKGLFAENAPELFYDDNHWIKEAFTDYEKRRFHQRSVDDAVIADNFISTSWYKYYLAVRWYKNEFIKVCRDNKLVISV